MPCHQEHLLASGEHGLYDWVTVAHFPSTLRKIESDTTNDSLLVVFVHAIHKQTSRACNRIGPMLAGSWYSHKHTLEGRCHRLVLALSCWIHALLQETQTLQTVLGMENRSMHTPKLTKNATHSAYESFDQRGYGSVYGPCPFRNCLTVQWT